MSEPHPPAGWPKPYPQMDAAPYWEALNAGRLTVQRCGACCEAVWPPKSFCPHCESDDLAWEEVSGHGELYSFSTVVRGPTPAFASIAPYSVGFARMDEGYMLFAEIEGAPEAMRVGAKVAVKLTRRGEQQLPVFELV